MILITHTTRYREGSEEFARVARTMAREISDAGGDVRLLPVESKGDLVKLFEQIAAEEEEITTFHFIGHSGLYGIMFGTTDWPEQFSPHEWRNLSIPFAEHARAYFHACRTARWFAPFFARTFGVVTYGYHWYTSFSLLPDRFLRERRGAREDAPLYVVSVPGRTSHGVLGALRKHTGRQPIEPMREYSPGAEESGSYDDVAALYDEVFADIAVREDEWAWVQRHLPEEGVGELLDIGCGNGSLLAALADRIDSGLGVDISAGMIERARARFGAIDTLRFTKIEGPHLPAADNTFDVAISFMSFRYLDWDPMIAEVRRVLRPGGRFLVVDMVATRTGVRDLPGLIATRLRHRRQSVRHPEFREKLSRLVLHPEWEEMLRHNPARAEHEYRWYLGSRFPQGSMVSLNVSRRHRLLAFDSGPVISNDVA